MLAAKSIIMRHSFLFILVGFALFSCTSNSGRSGGETTVKPGTVAQTRSSDTVNTNIIGEDWGNISVDTAKLLIKTFCEYSDAMKELNATKSVWFRRSDINDSFNKIFAGTEASLQSALAFDGYRIYFARYPSDWKDATKRDQNTIVITKTKATMLQSETIHEDILEINRSSGVFVQPLNDGGRCRPNCNGTLLLEPIYTQERHY